MEEKVFPENVRRERLFSEKGGLLLSGTQRKERDQYGKRKTGFETF